MKAFTLIIPVALGLCLSASAPAAPLHPFLQRDQWQLEVPAAWEWQGGGEATMLVLKKPSQYQPKVRRPFNLAWFGGAEFESFTLTCEARLDVFNKGNNDLCLAFGGLSDTEFHYAHLGETADGVHLHLHVVNNADRKPITTTRAKSLPWQPNHWHLLKLERDASSGSMKVWFDGEAVLESNDKSFGKGRIGLGSFDDLGAFRNLVITPRVASAPDIPSMQIELVAGGGTKVEHAPAEECRVTQPFGIAFDPQDNMYICEETHRILRVDAGTGTLTVVTGAKPKDGPPGDNGPAKDASFHAPHNIIADPAGNLYIADTFHYRVRRIDARTGIVTTVAGNGGKEVSGDGGPAVSAGLGWIACLAFNQDCSQLTISGNGKNSIRVVDMATGLISTLPGLSGSRAHAVDSKGNVFIPTRFGVRMRSPDGKVQTLEDPTAVPPLAGVKHLWADRDDNILIADAGNHRIRKLIVAGRKLITLAGNGARGTAGVPGPALQALLGEPHGIVTHPRTGDLYIADSRNHRILRLRLPVTTK